jgi:adenylate cyclase
MVRPRFLSLAEFRIYDSYLAAENHAEQPAQPIIVDVDEASLQRYGQWPWPRSLIAELLRRLRELDCAAVGIDLLLSERERITPFGPLEAAPERQDTTRPSSTPLPLTAGDRELAAVLRSGPFVIGQEFLFGRTEPSPRSCVLHPLRTTWVIHGGSQGTDDALPLHAASDVVCSIPALAGAATTTGFLNATPDEDGVLRASPLIIRYHGQLYASLPLATFMVANGSEQITLHRGPLGIAAIDPGEGQIPVDARGNLLIRYRGGPGTFQRVSALDVLEGRIDTDAFRGRVLFVGATSFGPDGTVASPLGDVLQGVEVLANVADNLLTGEFLQRPAYGRDAELLSALLAGLSATLLLALAGPVWGPPLVVAVGLALWRGSAWAFHTHGTFLSAVVPLTSLLVVGTGLVLVRYLVRPTAQPPKLGTLPPPAGP